LKYSLLLITGLAAALVFPLPEAKAEHSQEIGVAITQVIEVKEKSWDEIVSEQLKRKAEQDALEAERLAQIEAAQRAEEARVAQLAVQAKKVRQTAPKRVVTAFQQVSSNMFQYGSCVWFVAQKRAVGNWGNANQWLSNARAAGFATGNTPQVGAIAWTGRGTLGHVAYTEKVEGNRALISEMNYKGLGVLSQRWVSFDEFVWIY